LRGAFAQAQEVVASLAVDLNLAEAVDFTNLVMARVPKLFFKAKQPEFWHKPLKVRSEAQRQGLDPIPRGGSGPDRED